MRAFNETFRLSRDESYWRWKFHRSDEPLAAVAVDGAGTVHAQFAGIPSVWLVDGVPVRVVQICDFFARRHRDVIKGNVMMKTMETFHRTYGGRQDIKLVFGFPNATSARLHDIRMPLFESPEPIRTYVRRVPARRAAPLAADAEMRRMPTARQIDELWRAAAARYPCAGPRDADWFFWRFCHRPDVTDYITLSCLRDGKSLAAWAALRKEGNVLWVCDLVWDGRSENELARLDDAVLAEAARLGARRNSLWLQGDRAALSVLLEQGWVDCTCRQTIHLAMHLYDPSVDPADLYSRLYLTGADGDLI